ncbi:MAG: carboxypeptidase M32 [Leptospiraceae bacterium]|nr:carboxypeptidase M32 [Leptospiraceae bacterium]MCP5510723.1 carboxypeptidase M32 [Leptospiraceae bacterium]
METKEFTRYKKYWTNINHFQNILSLLHWDSEILLPENARQERADQIAVLSTKIHESFVSEELDEILHNLKNNLSNSTSNEQELFLLTRELEVLEKQRNRTKKLPSDLVENFSRTTNLAHGIWSEARKNKNFNEFSEVLEKIVSLSKEMADCYGYEKERYDALLEGYESDTKSEVLEKLFLHLKNSLIPLINQSKFYSNPFTKQIPIEYQMNLCSKLPSLLGLSDKSSRLDPSLHPFSTSIGKFDKRITTRYDEKDPLSAILAVMHEVGHAMYEQGLSTMQGYPSPLTEALSYGVHESMSRLWENQIGRSKAFWSYYYPIFIKELQIYHYDLPFETLYKYVNSVQKTKIRVEADQVTYNLHIILRFEIERELISGDLKVKDLPGLWNQKMKDYFDLEIENDAEGVLQDIHWSGGSFGYFPTYTLGNIYSAQLFHAFHSTNEDFWNQVESKGDFTSLHKWLEKHVYHKGKILDPKNLVKDATGEEPNSVYLEKFLKSKLREID